MFGPAFKTGDGGAGCIQQGQRFAPRRQISAGWRSVTEIFSVRGASSRACAGPDPAQRLYPTTGACGVKCQG